MMLLDFVLISLATWRVSSLITHEDGPGNIFARVRRAVGAERPGEMTGVAILFTCVWCMSVWVAFFVAPTVVLLEKGYDWPRYVLLVPAASAIAIIIESIVRD